MHIVFRTLDRSRLSELMIAVVVVVVSIDSDGLRISNQYNTNAQERSKVVELGAR